MALAATLAAPADLLLLLPVEGNAYWLPAPPPCSPLLLFQFSYKAVLLVKSTIPALLRRSKPADDAPIKVGSCWLLMPIGCAAPGRGQMKRAGSQKAS